MFQALFIAFFPMFFVAQNFGLHFDQIMQPIFRVEAAENSCLTDTFPILMYHHIRQYEDLDTAARNLSVSAKEFDIHMKYIKDAGYKSITTFDIENENVPCNAIMITFDDGYDNVYSTAQPILEKYDLHGIVSVILAKLDEKGYMTGNEIRKLSAQGWEIANHTWHHHFLSFIPKVGIPREILSSKKDLEGWFGVKIQSIAYPGGFYGPETIKIARTSHTYGFTTHFGLAKLRKDPLQLSRINVGPGLSGEDLLEMIKVAATTPGREQPVTN